MSEENVTDAADLKLARAIRDLPAEMQPERDLWVGVERQISQFPQQRRYERWLPWGVAASLLIGVSALLLNVVQLTSAPVVVQTPSATLDQMQVDYQRVRNPMVRQFEENNQALDPRTLQDIYRNIEIIEQARRELEIQVRQNPENRRLVAMLMRVNQQELDLLKQDFSSSGKVL
jgi:hypothetical protein